MRICLRGSSREKGVVSSNEKSHFLGWACNGGHRRNSIGNGYAFQGKNDSNGPDQNGLGQDRKARMGKSPGQCRTYGRKVLWLRISNLGGQSFLPFLL